VIDAHPFKTWYEAHYGVKMGIKKSGEREQPSEDLAEKSEKVRAKLTDRQKGRTLQPELAQQFASGRILAKITSRPGQTGRVDG
jgi:small subunit ribosomal protein S8e